MRSRFIGVLAATVVLTLLLPREELGAQSRRALVVGINRYEAAAGKAPAGAGVRGRITDLGGAVNDAQAMRDVLQARFAFAPGDVTMLTDQQATRAAILGGIERLLAQSSRGDVAVFYYAGHGSQRRNSLSPEASKLDQTLVPADANAGVFDIRDKELARAFNQFVDKGVELVLIFDSCHSGSVARGGLEGQSAKRRERWAAIDPRDAADAGAEKSPEERGALVISAAQDYQLATEMEGPGGQPNGIFTTALIATLMSVPPNEPVAEVFKSVKARMQSDGHPQEPVLAGPTDRLRRPLFGGTSGATGRTSVAVLRVSSNGTLTLQGGPALGIREGAVLRKVGVPADTGIRLRVDTVIGISESRARVVSGVAAGARPRIAVGDRFELERWVAPANAALSVAIVPAGLAPTAIRSVADEMTKLRGAEGVEWIDDPSAAPTDTTPTYVMRWAGSGWELRPQVGAAIALPASPTAAQVRAAIAQREKGRTVRFLLSLPPTRELASAFRRSFSDSSAVRLTSDPVGANYVLLGRTADAGLQYALVAPTASQATAGQSSLPMRTEWLATDGTPAGDSSTAGRLVEHAYTLAKVRSWLFLDAPPNEGAFPYRLAFRRLSDQKLVREGPFTGGERYEIVLVADSAQVTPFLERRRVYVFGIDSYGNGSLIYPSSNVENRVPFGLTADSRWPTEIPLGPRSAFRVQPPFGMDTFILLAADETVEPWAFQWTGVRGGETGRGGALERLLTSASGRSRGTGTETPANWSIDRVTIRSQAAP